MAVPVFPQGGRRGTQVMADNRGKVPAMLGAPLLGKLDVVVASGSEAPGIHLLRGRVPQLKEADRNVAAKRVDVARGERRTAPGDKNPMRVLVFTSPFLESFQSHDVHAIGAVDAALIEMGMVKKNAPEVVRKGDVGIEMHTPAVILEPTHAGVDGCSFIKVAAVFLEQVRLHADRPVLFRDALRLLVVVRGDHDRGVDVGMIEPKRVIEQVVESHTGGNVLEAKGFGSERRRGIGILHGLGERCRLNADKGTEVVVAVEPALEKLGIARVPGDDVVVV